MGRPARVHFLMSELISFPDSFPFAQETVVPLRVQLYAINIPILECVIPDRIWYRIQRTTDTPCCLHSRSFDSPKQRNRPSPRFEGCIGTLTVQNIADAGAGICQGRSKSNPENKCCECTSLIRTSLSQKERCHPAAITPINGIRRKREIVGRNER